MMTRNSDLLFWATLYTVSHNAARRRAYRK